MKRIIYLLAIAFWALTLSLPATAQPAEKTDLIEQDPALPINTNVVYLVIVGLVIGIFLVRKSKQSETGVREIEP